MADPSDVRKRLRERARDLTTAASQDQSLLPFLGGFGKLDGQGVERLLAYEDERNRRLAADAARAERRKRASRRGRASNVFAGEASDTPVATAILLGE